MVDLSGFEGMRFQNRMADDKNGVGIKSPEGEGEQLRELNKFWGLTRILLSGRETCLRHGQILFTDRFQWISKSESGILPHAPIPLVDFKTECEIMGLLRKG